MKNTAIRMLMIAAAATTMSACTKKPADTTNMAVADTESATDENAMAATDMPMVGGAPMDPANDVVTNASKAGDLKRWSRPSVRPVSWIR